MENAMGTCRISSLLFLLLAVLIGTCSGSNYNLKFSLPEGRIVGGREAEPHGHPYQVSLQLKVLWMRAHVCGGSIVSERWILTAGHCITELPLPWLIPIDVVAGAHRVNGQEGTVQIRRVVEKVVHPDYNGGVAPFDLALLRLDHALRFTKEVLPVRLPPKASVPAGRSTLTGWGVLRSSLLPVTPQKLQTIDLPVLSYDECYKAVEDLKENEETNPLNEIANMCTGPLTGGKSACNGDSGGPLVQYDDQVESVEEQENSTGSEGEAHDDLSEEIQNLTEELQDIITSSETNPSARSPRKCLVREQLPQDGPVQIGVVSWGMQPCGSEGAPTVYTRVSSFIDFIEEHIYSS